MEELDLLSLKGILTMVAAFILSVVIVQLLFLF